MSFEPCGDGRYRATAADGAIIIDADRLDRDGRDLYGELLISTTLPGTKAHKGILYLGSHNFSSQRTRRDLARHLAERSRAKVDWISILEAFSIEVAQAERNGLGAVDLSTVPKGQPDRVYNFHGLILPCDHPSIIFGDGGTGKSYLALALAGWLTDQGVKVLYADWELNAQAHRDRLARLTGDESLPSIHYASCDKPLCHESDRLRRIIRQHGIGFCVFDSVAFATVGAPEAAEASMGYFRSTRSLGVGSVHLAHITKALEGNDQRPFGSVFYHNSARTTWYIKQADETVTSDTMTVGLYNRKNNVGSLAKPVAFQMHFGADRTRITPTELRDVPQLYEGVQLWRRMKDVLRSGPRRAHQVADELGASVDAVRKAAQRHPGVFRRTMIGRDVELALLVRDGAA